MAFGCPESEPDNIRIAQVALDVIACLLARLLYQLVVLRVAILLAEIGDGQRELRQLIIEYFCLKLALLRSLSQLLLFVVQLQGFDIRGCLFKFLLSEALRGLEPVIGADKGSRFKFIPVTIFLLGLEQVFERLVSMFARSHPQQPLNIGRGTASSSVFGVSYGRVDSGIETRLELRRMLQVKTVDQLFVLLESRFGCLKFRRGLRSDLLALRFQFLDALL